MLLLCGAVCGGGVQGETMPLGLLSGFQSLPLLPTSKLDPFGAYFQVGRLVYILGPYGSLEQTLLRGWEFLPLPQPSQVFSVRGFEALFPHTGTLGYMVCLAPQLFLPVYPHANVGLPSLPAAASPTLVLQPQPCFGSCSPWLPISAPPTSLGECFFFNSLVVRLPYSSIFCQFWMFFVFKFVVVLLLVVRGGTVYLPIPPSWLALFLKEKNKKA